MPSSKLQKTAKIKRTRLAKGDNPLIGKSQSAKDSEDAVLLSLSRIGSSAESESTSSDPFGRKSRFWFRMVDTDDVAKTVSRNKKLMSKKTVEHVDQSVEDRLSTYKKEMPPKLKSNIDAVREFFLTEIAPLTMASSGGAIQSRAVASRLVDSEIDSAIFSRFENMVNRASTLKMAMFVLKYFGLPEDQLSSILGLHNQAVTPIEAEVKAILQKLNDAPSSRQMRELHGSINKLSKGLTNGNRA